MFSPVNRLERDFDLSTPSLPCGDHHVGGAWCERICSIGASYDDGEKRPRGIHSSSGRLLKVSPAHEARAYKIMMNHRAPI